MSESEMTSSFPDRLAELPKTPSASKLKQSKWSLQLQHNPFNNNMKINLCHLSNLLLYQLLLYLWDEPWSRSVFAALCTCTPTDLQSKEKKVKSIKMKWRQKNLMQLINILVKLYCRGGELESTPVLPNGEEDRSAWQSTGFSTSGGVLGTRSGLPDCMPENKSNKKQIIYTQWIQCLQLNAAWRGMLL